MATDGTEFEIEIATVGKADAESAAMALAKLADEMDAATAATDAASQAVKAAELAYKQTETTADRTAKALEKITLAADLQRGKLKEAMDVGDMGAAERAAKTLQKLLAREGEAATAAKLATAAMSEQAVTLDKLKSAASSAVAHQEKVAKANDAAAKAAKQANAAAEAAKGTGNLGKLATALGDFGGPLGNLGKGAVSVADAWGDMKEVIGVAGPYVAVAVAIVAIVAAVAALAAAAVVGAAKIAAWAVSLSDAAEGQLALYEGITQSVEAGAQLNDQIATLLTRVPLTRKELDTMATDLAKAGKKGDEFSTALEAAAEAAAKAKFGPQWAKQMNSLEVQSRRLQDNFTGAKGIFSGLKTGPVKEGLSSIVALFDEGTASSKAIKAVFESLFQPLLDGVTEFIPKMVAAFIQFEILVLKALIAVKPFGSYIVTLAQAFGILALVITGVLLVGILMLIAPFALFAGLITAAIFIAIKFGETLFEIARVIAQGPVAAVGYLITKLGELVEWMSGMSLGDIGKAMIEGLANGITGAADSVKKALGGAVTGALDSAKSLLGIKSPSRVFAAELGEPMGEGTAMGLENASGGVASTLETMTAPPDPQTSAAAAAGGSNSSSGAGNVFYFTVNAEGGDPNAIKAKIKELLLEVFEGNVAQLGEAPSA